MNLLKIVSSAAEEIGLEVPSSIVSNRNPQVRQLRSLLTRLCIDLCKQHDWESLIRTHWLAGSTMDLDLDTSEGSIVATLHEDRPVMDYVISCPGLGSRVHIVSQSGAQIRMERPAQGTATVQARFERYRYDLPQDHLRMLDNTLYGPSGLGNAAYGSVLPQGWRKMMAMAMAGELSIQYRLRAGKLEIWPPLSGRASYEYIGKNFVLSDGEDASDFTDDDDRTVFDSSMLVSGLIALFRQANGIDATFDLSNFQSLLAASKNQDTPAPELNLNGGRQGRIIDRNNIPEGNWNV